MLRKLAGKSKENGIRKRFIRFPGICADAKALGVHRIHLFLVLKGERDSEPLKRRYRQLKRETTEKGSKP
jgi:hypothetical protein